MILELLLVVREIADVARDAFEFFCNRGKGGVYVGGGETTDCTTSLALWTTDKRVYGKCEYEE